MDLPVDTSMASCSQRAGISRPGAGKTPAAGPGWASNKFKTSATAHSSSTIMQYTQLNSKQLNPDGVSKQEHEMSELLLFQLWNQTFVLILGEFTGIIMPMRPLTSFEAALKIPANEFQASFNLMLFAY